MCNSVVLNNKYKCICKKKAYIVELSALYFVLICIRHFNLSLFFHHAISKTTLFECTLLCSQTFVFPLKHDIVCYQFIDSLFRQVLA